MARENGVKTEINTSYQVFDRDVMGFIGRFDTLEEIVECLSEAVMVTDGVSKKRSYQILSGYVNNDMNYGRYPVDFAGDPVRPLWHNRNAECCRFVIVDLYSDKIVTRNTINDCVAPYRKKRFEDLSNWHYENGGLGSRLFKRKNVNKIKANYSSKLNPPSSVWPHDTRWDTKYDLNIWSYYRSIRTTSERAQNDFIECEYGREYPRLVRAARNPRNLASSWDDRRINVYDQGKSWKHNSKRKRQYKL